MLDTEAAASPLVSFALSALELWRRWTERGRHRCAPRKLPVRLSLVRRLVPWRAASWGCLVGLVVALGAEALHVLAGQNFHTVIAGRIYRSAQPSERFLERAIRRHGIRTVVNLRGCCSLFSWYWDECRATHRLGLEQQDVYLSACRLPSVHEIRRLVEVLDRSAGPILLHCRRGADRTGMVAVLCQLLYTDASLSEALWQLTPRYGHVPLGKPRCCDRFFDLYTDWLAEQGLEHSREVFRHWLLHEYCPGECRCELQPLDIPTELPRGQPATLRIRATNTSVKTWRLRPGSNAGIHAVYVLGDIEGHIVTVGRAGMYERAVAPGESIDLVLALPPLHVPGAYSLMVDMVDEQHCWFFQGGGEPLMTGLRVREQ